MREGAQRSNLYWLGCLVFATMLWGSGFPIIKMMADAFPPLVLAALRGVGGALTLLIVFSLMRIDLMPRSWGEIRDWTILGALNGWVANMLVGYGLQALPAGQASMLQASGPLITAMICAWLFTDEKLTIRRVFGILTGILGVALLIGPRLSGGFAASLAAFAMIGVALSYALANIYVRMMPQADPKRLGFGQQALSGIFGTALALMAHGTAGFLALPAYFWHVVVLCAVSTAAPIVIYMAALRAVGPTRASVAGYLVPVWAVFLSAIILGETLGLREGVAGLIIITGVYIVTTARQPKAQ